MSDITIYHNPKCGTSRNVLSLIRNSGAEPHIIEYLVTPPSRETLHGLIAAMNIPVRAVLRKKGTPYEDLGLDDPKWTDEQLLDFMLAHPILINRPIVLTPLGTRLRSFKGARLGQARIFYACSGPNKCSDPRTIYGRFPCAHDLVQRRSERRTSRSVEGPRGRMWAIRSTAGLAK